MPQSLLKLGRIQSLTSSPGMNFRLPLLGTLPLSRSCFGNHRGNLGSQSKAKTGLFQAASESSDCLLATATCKQGTVTVGEQNASMAQWRQWLPSHSFETIEQNQSNIHSVSQQQCSESQKLKLQSSRAERCMLKAAYQHAPFVYQSHHHDIEDENLWHRPEESTSKQIHGVSSIMERRLRCKVNTFTKLPAICDLHTGAVSSQNLEQDCEFKCCCLLDQLPVFWRPCSDKALIS